MVAFETPEIVPTSLKGIASPSLCKNLTARKTWHRKQSAFLNTA
jgi:hypothetical protein